MLTVVSLEDTSLPKEFIAILPTHCTSCGAETEITESLSMLVCPNPDCIIKSVHRMVTLLADLGVKDMGEAKCRKFLDHFGVTNPYAIFHYEPDVDGALFEGCGIDFSHKIAEQVYEKRTMLLWEFVKIGNLPKIRDSARKIFSNYDDLEVFYEDLEEGGIAFIQNLLSIKKGAYIPVEEDEEDDFGYDSPEDNKISIRAVETYNTLLYFKESLLFGVSAVEIKQLDTEVLNICISTSVGKPYTSKSDFVSKMNSEFGHKVHLNFLSSVTNDCNFLIWSKEGSATSKVQKAYRINDKREGTGEEPVYVMTGSEFQEHLETL